LGNIHNDTLYKTKYGILSSKDVEVELVEDEVVYESL